MKNYTFLQRPSQERLEGRIRTPTSRCSDRIRSVHKSANRWTFVSVVLLFVLYATGSSFAQKATPSTAPAKEDNKDPQKICPTVSVSCSLDPKLTEPFDFTATVAGGDPNVMPTYHWEVVNGEIIAGQGTPAIRVKALVYQTVTATLRIGGFNTVCSRTASCSTTLDRPIPPPKKIDSYGLIRFDQVKARLAQFAGLLKQHPGAMGYIFGYDGRQTRAGKAQAAMDSAKQHLVEKLEIEKDRIGTVHGGSKAEFTIDLWLVPVGSPLPVADPDKEKNR